MSASLSAAVGSSNGDRIDSTTTTITAMAQLFNCKSIELQLQLQLQFLLQSARLLLAAAFQSGASERLMARKRARNSRWPLALPPRAISGLKCSHDDEPRAN